MVLANESQSINTNNDPLVKTLDRAATWTVNLTISEPGGTNDWATFGEATDAYDGPNGPNPGGSDSYDIPKPPQPPSEPYVRFYFEDGLSGQYSKLSGDYLSYPDTEKVWNLTVLWVNESAPSSTPFIYVPNWTISWDSSELYGCKYDAVELWNLTGTTEEMVADMLTESSHVYTQQWIFVGTPINKYYWVDGVFEIRCIADTDPPEITDYSPGSGETGDSFTFNASITDLVGVNASAVRVNWSHGGFSGNDTMSSVGGSYFEKTITLDESTSDLTYHFYAKDTARTPNDNYTSEFSANVIDDEYPTPVSDDTTSPLSTGGSITFGLTVTDNIDVIYVVCKLSMEQGGMWSSWTTDVSMSEGSSDDWTTSGLSVPSDATEVEYYFEVNDGTFTVYIYNGSLAVTENEGTAQGSPFGNSVSDDDDPSLDADNSDASGNTGDLFNFDITASDNINVAGVNVSWSHGALSGNKALALSAGHWTGSVTLDHNLGDLTYTVQVNDTSNNYFLGSQQTKSVTDNDAPLISDVSAVPASQIVDGYVNITANVSDNINLNSVMVAITGPSGFTPVNDSMDNAGGDVHYYYENYSIVGIYNYSIWANDSSDNSVTSATYQFEIVAEILVTNLSVKWNFISLPFNQTVNKTDLIFHYNGTDYNWTEAIDPANGPLIDYFIYGWNRGPSGQIYQTVDVLRTWIIILDVRLLWLYTEEIVIFKTNMNNRKASY